MVPADEAWRIGFVKLVNAKSGELVVPGLLQTELDYILNLHRVDGADDGLIGFLPAVFHPARVPLPGNGLQPKINVSTLSQISIYFY